MVVVMAATALVVAACGDDDGGETTEAAPQTAATSAAPSGGEETTMAPETSAAETPMAGATVVVGGEEFNLETQTVCVSMGGALGAQFDAAAGDATFNVDLPPESWDGTTDDWSPASVRLDVGDDFSWRAGDEVLSGMDGLPPEVMVTGFSIDGSTATGTAVVVDLNSLMVGDPQTADMTFSVACS
jgi:hypothetical protein